MLDAESHILGVTKLELSPVAVLRRSAAKLAWRCRREIQFGRLGELLALESEHCEPGDEFRKAFSVIDR